MICKLRSPHPSIQGCIIIHPCSIYKITIDPIIQDNWRNFHPLPLHVDALNVRPLSKNVKQYTPAKRKEKTHK